jgi:hypothetical protein
MDNNVGEVMCPELNTHTENTSQGDSERNGRIDIIAPNPMLGSRPSPLVLLLHGSCTVVNDFRSAMKGG